MSLPRVPGQRPRYDLRHSIIVNGRVSFRKDRFAGMLIKNGTLAEKSIEHPRANDIDLNLLTCYLRVRYLNDDIDMDSDEDMDDDDDDDDDDEEDPYDEIEVNEIGKTYPYKVKSLILNTDLMHDTLDKYIQKTVIKATVTKPMNALLYLKFPPTPATQDRIVMVTKYEPPNGYILPFMDEYVAKYEVKHVRYVDGRCELLNQLTDGTLIENGGEGFVSDSDTELICINANASDSYLQCQMFIKEKEITYIKSHCKANCNAYETMVRSALTNWLKNKWGNQWKEKFTFITPSGKAKEFDKMLQQNGYELSLCTWNKSKTQQTYTFNYQQLIESFGDEISQEIVTKYGGHYILSITTMILVYYAKKNIDNLKIRAYVKKIPAKKSKKSKKSKE